jgi:hypothetical protein
MRISRSSSVLGMIKQFLYARLKRIGGRRSIFVWRISPIRIYEFYLNFIEMFTTLKPVLLDEPGFEVKGQSHTRRHCKTLVGSKTSTCIDGF